MENDVQSLPKRFRCPDCPEGFTTAGWLVSHVEKNHKELFDDSSWTTRQYLFHRRNKTNKPSKCVVCSKPTPWKEETGKYGRICTNVTCRAELSRRAKENMMKIHGVPHMLNDAEMQKKMLESRGISGSYTFRDGKTTLKYVGSYELDFLQFCDQELKLDPSDITECNVRFKYKFDAGDGKGLIEHFYMPDFWFGEFKLIIEIKDGGDNPNNHPKILDVDKKKEQLKDQAVIHSREYSYIKIVNKEYSLFVDLIAALRDRPINLVDPGKPLIVIP